MRPMDLFCITHFVSDKFPWSHISLQLSDFGLAMWKPEDSRDLIESNVVGTFGYLAPEYIMEGRVSEKIDVYSFGVVLLELISGRRPISKTSLEGQQSLVQWVQLFFSSH